MTVFKEHGKTSSSQTSRLTERPTCIKNTLKHQTTAAKVTGELNQHLNSSVSIETDCRELNKAGYHGRAAIRKLLLSTINIRKRMKWCRDHKGRYTDQWKQVIFSYESSFSLFPSEKRFYVWRQPREGYNLDFFPHVNHGSESVMAWAAISWNSLGPIVTLHGRISSKDYLNILGENVHLVDIIS